MNALAVTSPSRASHSQTERLAREWVVRFAELYSVSLVERGARFVELWVSAVVDLKPEILEAACRKAMQTCKFFPTPAEVRALVDHAETNGFQLEAEGEWHKLLAWIHRNYHPDIGICRGAPSLPAIVEHAARAAGGYRYLEGCSEAELVWAKKAFLADLQNVRQAERVEHLLGNGEAKRILADITRQATPKLLVAAPKTEAPADPPSHQEVRSVLDRISKATPEEQQARLRRLQERTAELDALNR